MLEKANRIKEWARTATPEQKRATGSLPRGSGPSFSYDDVKRMAEKPMQTMLVPQINVETSLLVRPDLAVLCCEKDVSEKCVDESNRLTRSQCSKYFASSSALIKPIWLDIGVEPDDSWEKRHPEKRPIKPPPRAG